MSGREAEADRVWADPMRMGQDLNRVEKYFDPFPAVLTEHDTLFL